MCIRDRYRNANINDIYGVSQLQKKYHIYTISEEDKPDGFVTTLFTEEQFKELIEKENGPVSYTHLDVYKRQA